MRAKKGLAGKECPYYMMGTCSNVKGNCVCVFAHTDKPPGDIPCGRGRGPGRVCANGAGCKYMHPDGNPMGASGSNDTCAYEARTHAPAPPGTPHNNLLPPRAPPQLDAG